MAASQFLIVGFREEFGVIDGGGPGGETGGDGEVIVRGAVRRLGVVAGEFQEFLSEQGPAGQVCVAFQGVGGQEHLKARHDGAAGHAGVAAGERVGAFASGDDHRFDVYVPGEIGSEAVDEGRTGAAGVDDELFGL